MTMALRQVAVEVAVEIGTSLAMFLALVTVMVGGLAWLIPSVRCRIHIWWRYGRNLLWLLAARASWPRLAASSGLGAWRARSGMVGRCR